MVKLNKPEQRLTIPHATTGICRLETATNKIIARNDNGESLVFNQKLYTDDSIKQELMVTVQNNKCCYCEKIIVDDFEVEHYRPKEAVVHGGQLSKPGYYWLTYDLDNLLYSCNKCNKIKGNDFPLEDEVVRARNHNMNIEDESPQIINPCIQNPNDYLEFLGLEMVAKSGDNFNTATKTIDTIKLDRNELFHLRSNKYFELRTYVHDVYELAKSDDELEKEARVKCIEYLDSNIESDKEFSMMVKCNYEQLKPNLTAV
jgi:uncharacterized protein (TIGR02646 family)